MDLNVKNSGSCTYDQLSLGEVMLRLDPGESRVRCARQFNVYEGGGEYNVARGLRKCFQLKTAVVTALAENDIGYLIEDLIMQGGVDTSFIKWIPYDGIGRKVRNGLNFTERGFGVRGALGVSDRANTAVSQIKPGDIDWEHIFGDLGVRWFHTGGIYAALSLSSSQVVIEAIKTAKKHGTIVSYDLNYRLSLWSDIGGKAKAQEINKEIAPYIDVMIGNEEDFSACLGYEIDGNADNLKVLDTTGYENMINQVSRDYPNMKIIANTLRSVKTATVNDWSALVCSDGKIYTSQEYRGLEIFDRVGGGDSFASGLIYGLMKTGDPQQAVDYGAAHGALAMTTPGDTSMVRVKEVEALIKGTGARVQR